MDGSIVLAYSFVDDGVVFTNGQLLALTSEHEYHLDHKKSRIRISIDGTARFDFKYGAYKITDTKGNDIAAYHRKDGTINTFSLDIFGFEFDLHRTNTNKHHQVFFKSGNYAEISNSAADDSRVNAIYNIEGELSEEEKLLLISLVIFEAVKIAH